MKRILAIIVAVSALLNPTAALGIDWGAAYNSTVYVSQFFDLKDLCVNDADAASNPASACCPTNFLAPDASGNITPAPGGDTEETAFRYFYSKGLTAEQTAGIIGNLIRESNVNPYSDNPAAEGGGGGIAQWERDRWSGASGLLAFAQKAGKPWQDITVQLNFMWAELNGTPPAHKRAGLAQVRSKSTPEEAAVVFEDAFESPRVKHHEQSGKYARQDYQRALSKGWNSGPQGSLDNTGTTATPNPTATCTGDTASAPVTAGDFIVYNQYDPAWENKPYGSSTIGPSGCGPSAMAMIITALTKTRVTPDVVAAYAGSQYIPGVGSSWNLPRFAAPHWNLTAKFIGKNSSVINSVLQSGGLVITSGQGALPFTQGGHYIVIRGLTASGKWLVGDSGHTSTNSKEWDISGIVSNMNDGSVYAITK